MEEKKTVEFMIRLYCKKNHKSDKKSDLCEDCNNLLEYANKRADNCRFKETKTFCSMCSSHCYAPVMKTKIREVMKFSGPRMLIYNPPLAVSHIFYTVKYKLKEKVKEK